MAVQDAQAGFGYLHGIAGAITFTGTEGTPADLMGAGAKVNLSSINLTHNWTDEEIASQDGTIIEAVVASKEYKDIRFEFMPKGTTRANAETVVDTFAALVANEVVTFAAATATVLNTAFNWKGGLDIGFTRDGRCVISGNGRQYKKSDGTFGALAKITG
jgi:hypothetical protein